MILLDRNKSAKEYEIDTSDGLKPYSHTVGGSVHNDETSMSKIHDKGDNSRHKQSKEAEYDFDVRYVVMSPDEYLHMRRWIFEYNFWRVSH